MPNLMDLVAEAGAGIVLQKVATGARGDEYVGPCPACGGTDRFHVWPDQKNGEGSYWCRGCDRGGDAIQFCIDFLGMSFPEAAKHVGRPAAISSRRMRTPRARAAARVETESAPAVPVAPERLWTEKATAFAKACHATLMADAETLAWLAARGIEAATVRRFGLGQNAGENDKDLYRPRESWGLPEIKKEDGTPKKLWLPMGLVIPLCHGHTAVRLRIRRPHPEAGPEALQGTRYYVVPGSSMEQLLIRPTAPVIVVVEAELDALAVAAAAPSGVGVLALGSSSPHPDARAMAALTRAMTILVALDFDKAGAGAWDARLRSKGRPDAWCWRRAFRQAVRWPTPDGKDPGEAVAAGVSLTDWIAAGLPPVLTLPPVKTPSPVAKSVSDSGTSGHLPSELPLVWGAGDFLAGAKATTATMALEEILERYGSTGLALRAESGGLRWTWPDGFSEALRAAVERAFGAVEQEWIETEGWTK